MKRRNIWALPLLTISSVWLLTWIEIASAQSLPRLKPIPPRGGSDRAVAVLALQTPSAWQALTN
jgi:hypothetical protein